MDDIIGHRWIGDQLQLLVQWSLGDSTWEGLSDVNKLAALDRYLELHGVHTPKKLPRLEGK